MDKLDREESRARTLQRRRQARASQLANQTMTPLLHGRTRSHTRRVWNNSKIKQKRQDQRRRKHVDDDPDLDQDCGVDEELHSDIIDYNQDMLRWMKHRARLLHQQAQERAAFWTGEAERYAEIIDAYDQYSAELCRLARQPHA